MNSIEKNKTDRGPCCAIRAVESLQIQPSPTAHNGSIKSQATCISCLL